MAEEMEPDDALALAMDSQTETTLLIDTDMHSPLDNTSIKQEPDFHTNDDCAKLSDNYKYAFDVDLVDIKTEIIDNASYQNLDTRYTDGNCSTSNYVDTGISHDRHVTPVNSEPKHEPLETTEHGKFIIEIDTCKDEYYETHGYPNSHPNANLDECVVEQDSGRYFATKERVQMDHSYCTLVRCAMHSSVYTTPCAVVLNDIRYNYPYIASCGFVHMDDIDPSIKAHMKHTPYYVNVLQTTQEKTLSCRECGVGFTYKVSLKKHMHIHTGEKRHKCSLCEVSFTRKYALTCHMRTHTREKPYKCTVCGVGFKHVHGLNYHTAEHTGETSHICTVCGVEFTQKCSLDAHVRIHTGENSHKCSVCGVSFTNKYDLTHHIRSHTGEKPYICTICGVCFAYKRYLATHMMIHTGEKPYKCSVCGVRFTQKGHLDTHMRIHSREKPPYKCSVCGDEFSRKHGLKIHTITHKGEKPHKCGICEVRFTQKRDLTRHARTHTGQKTYKCSTCGRAFAYKGSLNKHTLVCTGEKIHKCDICKISFACKRYLAGHMLTHVDRNNPNVQFVEVRFAK